VVRVAGGLKSIKG